MHDPVDQNTAEMITRAAKGDVDAQGTLADWAMQCADEKSAPFGHCAHLAEAFARMAASHGGALDRLRLARALIYAAEDATNVADLHSAHSHQAEALALLNELADEGDDQAVHALQAAAESWPAAALASAARLRRLITPVASVLTYADTTSTEGMTH